MKRGSTMFLRTAVIVLGVAVLVLCIFVLPHLISSENVIQDYKPILIGMYVTALPFYLALFQTLKLLNYIDKNKAFSEASVQALKVVKYCAYAISVFYAVAVPYIVPTADRDDAPGVIVIGLLVIGTSFVIATSAAVLQKLLENVIDIKSENDLTV